MSLNWKLNIDGEIYSREHQSIVYALNRVLDSNKNPTSVDEYSMKYHQCCQGKIIGVITTKTAIVLFSLSGSYLELGLYKNNTYNIILRTQYIETSNQDAIRGVCDYNIKGETIIAWCNGVRDSSTKPCILNIDNLPFKSGINPTTFELNNPEEIGLIYLFPEIKSVAQLSNIHVDDSGGGLPSGAYYIALGYGVNPYDITNYIYVSNPISIYVASSGLPYKDIVGSEPNENTSKSIKGTIGNIDINFKYLTITVIHKANNVLTGYIKSEAISNPTKNITIDFLSNLEKVDVGTILENNIVYEKVHSMTKLDRKLILGKMKVANINYQMFANNIKVEYVTNKNKSYYSKSGSSYIDSYKNNWNIVFEKSFMPNEVYALYIRLILKDGSRTDAFHIPGRPPKHELFSDPSDKYYVINSGGVNYSYKETATIEDGIGNSLDNVSPVVISAMKDDAAISPNVRLFHTRDTSFIHNGRNYLGYWENENELYPNTSEYLIWDVDSFGNGIPAGDLRNEKVRHHRMPSLKKLANPIDPTTSSVKVVGINLTDIKFPNYIRDEIVGFEILYAKRNFGNSVIQGQSLLIPLTKYKLGGDPSFVDNTKYRPCTLFKSITTGSFTAPDNKFVIFQYDLLKTNSPLYSSFIAPQLVLNLDSSVSTLTNSSLVDKLDITSITNASFEDSVRKIINSKYVPNSNNENADIDNTYGQSCISLDIEHNNLKLSQYPTVFEGTMGIQLLRLSYFVDLCMFKTDCYFEYFNQDLISCGKVYLRDNFGGFPNSTEIYNGDVFIGLSSYRVTSFLDESGDIYISKFLLGYPIYTPHNIELRFEGDGKYIAIPPNKDRDKERIFPKLGGDNIDLSIPGTSLFYPSSLWKFLDNYTQVDNFYGIGNRGYNFDYSSVNDIIQSIIYNIYNPRVDVFTNRVHVSNPNQTEALGLGWRRFFYDSYREMPADKGDITLLRATDDILYIQCEYGLFIDNPKDSLDAQNITVGLQETTILSRRPKEVLFDDDGEIGCNNMFGAIVTKYGYCVIDSAKGALYILRDGIKEITVVDVSSYLKLYAPLNQPEYNIFYDGGLMLAYDNEYERLLICKKKFNEPINSEEEIQGIDKSFTLSYHLVRDHFISFHSYTPDYIFGNKFKLMSIKNDDLGDDPELPTPENHLFGVIYTHNIENTTGKFYRKRLTIIAWEQEFHRSVVDILYHSIVQATPQGTMLVGQHFGKILDSVSWISAVYQNGTRLYDETVDKIAVYNDTQCTGELVVPNSNDWFNTNCGKNINETWYYNNLRDCVINNKDKFMEYFEFISSNIDKNAKDWFDKSYFIGKFVVARLISEQPDKVVKIHDIYIDFEQDKR